MDFKQWALGMYPYWIVGIGVICAVLSTKQKDLLRINKRALIDWVRFLVVVTTIKYFLYRMLHSSVAFDSIKSMPLPPIGAVLTVFWEDAVHGLPLLILRKLIGVSKWTKPIHLLLLGTVMLEFGIGHLYQGILPSIFLSFYIPYSIKMGEKHGFGTVMIGHMLFDSFSMLFIKCVMGL